MECCCSGCPMISNPKVHMLNPHSNLLQISFFCTIVTTISNTVSNTFSSISYISTRLRVIIQVTKLGKEPNNPHKPGDYFSSLAKRFCLGIYHAKVLMFSNETQNSRRKCLSFGSSLVNRLANQDYGVPVFSLTQR